MRYKSLGKTGLFVSELCLGAMTFGGKGFWQAIGKLAHAEVETIIGTSLDAGINFIDTADVYSEGESEKLVGAALKALGRPRDQIVMPHARSENDVSLTDPPIQVIVRIILHLMRFGR